MAAYMLRGEKGIINALLETTFSDLDRNQNLDPSLLCYKQIFFFVFIYSSMLHNIICAILDIIY